MLRAQCGDRDALELLLRSVQPSVHRYLCGLVSAIHADDVLQEVLVVIASKLAWLEHAELLRAWTFRIASRAGFRHLKKERRWQEQPVEHFRLEELPAADTLPSGDLLRELLATSGVVAETRFVVAISRDAARTSFTQG